MGEFKFEKLVIWQKSRVLVKSVYNAVAAFPKEEKYGLSDQLRRAVISISSNIAEGSGRYSDKEKLHFLEIAYSSLMEVICQIILCADLRLCEEKTKIEILWQAEILAKQMSAYRKSILKRLEPHNRQSAQ